MPELPEVETIRRGLNHTIRGKKIRRVEVRLSKIVSLGPHTVSNIRQASRSRVEKFVKLLIGQKIETIRRRSKMLIIDLSGPLTLLIHLKMTGQLIFAKKGERKLVKIMNIENSKTLLLPHRYTHVIFEFTDGSKLFFNDLRQFGYLRLVRDEDLAKVRELAEYGPEPLAKDFSFEYFSEKAKRRGKLSIKQFLTETKVVAGIGNIYSDEILYWAKVRPTRLVSRVKNLELKKIYQYIKIVLKKAVAAQGSSVGDFFKVDGSEGTYKLQHMVYGRSGEKCKHCAGIIQSVKLGGRTSSFCPREQH